MTKTFRLLLPLLFLFTVNLVFFHRAILRGQIPFPGDFVLGVYYPWLDYKWPGFPAGVPVKNPLLADVPSLFYPLKVYSMSLFRQGLFPSWNPLMFNGYPLLANFQSGVLNPANFVFLVLSAPAAWSVFIAVQPFLGALFMYLFLRSLRLLKPASLAGSLAFAYSGFNLIWLEYGIHGYVAAFIPLLLLLARQLTVTGRTLFFGAAISFILALQIFSGYPQISLYTIILLQFWVLFLSQGQSVRFKLKSVVRLSSWVFLGLILASFQLLPGFELFLNSQRPGEAVTGGSEVTFLQWPQLAGLIAPDFFGNPATGNYWGPGNYTNHAGYIGAVVAVLALLTVVSRHRFSRFYWFVFVTSLVLALPTPVSRFVSHLPLFSAATATRILVFTGFSAAVLASIGLHHLLSGRMTFSSIIRRAIIPVILLLGLIAGITWPLMFLQGHLPDSASPAFQKTLTFFATNLAVSQRNLVLPIFFSLAAFSLAALGTKFRRFMPVIAVVLTMLIAIEHFRFGWKYNPFFPGILIYPSTPVIDHLRQIAGRYRISGGDVLPLSLWTAFDLQSSTGYDAVYPGLWARFLSALDGGDIDHPKGRIGSMEIFSSPLLNLTSTRYLLALKRDKLGQGDPAGTPSYRLNLPQFRPIFSDKSVQILDNPAALPRFSLVPQTIISNDDHETIKLLSGPDFNPNRTVIISHLAGPKLDSPSQPETSLQVIVSGSDRYLLRANTTVPQMLLNTGSYYPGWHALIDGQKTTIYRSNFAFQSILVPAGAHEIEFTYRPLSLTIGALLSLVSASFLAVLIFFPRDAKAQKISRQTP